MDWSYIAGYFDGEGCVNFSKMSRGGSTRTLGWYNTHRESLEAMRDFMGVGKVTERNREASGFHGKKRAFILSISSKAALLHALDNMLPHLLIKREKAVALREYLIASVDERRAANFGKVAAVSTEQLRAWYALGESYEAIAKRLGVTYTAVGQAFRLRGIEARRGGWSKGVRKSDETRARMRAAQRALWADPAVRAHRAELRRQRRVT